MRNLKIIGLTGGIGAGKSHVAKLAMNNFPLQVIFTDQVAKDQMQKGEVSYKKVLDYLGEGILDEFGQINRSLLAKMMFESDELRLKINELTHNQVTQFVNEQIDYLRNDDTTKYLLIETALLIEAGYDSMCDAIWYVYSCEETRRTRLKTKRDYSEEKIDSILKAQKKEEDFRKIATFVISNDFNTSDEDLLSQITDGIKNLIDR